MDELMPFPVIARRLIDGMEIRFESEADAAEFMSIPKSSIRDCVNGKQTQTHGFEWSKDNRRAERTCRPEVCDDGAGAWGVYCSECCYRFVGPYGSRDLPERMAARRDIMPHYCPSCGARVEVD